jgi:hypothetical protein
MVVTAFLVGWRDKAMNMIAGLWPLLIVEPHRNSRVAASQGLPRPPDYVHVYGV